jgi:hypothetical protein
LAIVDCGLWIELPVGDCGFLIADCGLAIGDPTSVPPIVNPIGNRTIGNPIGNCPSTIGNR